MKILAGLALASALAAGSARAGEDSFRSIAEGYLMGASMSGTLDVGPLSTRVDVPASTVFSNLKFAALADYRGEAPTWAVQADVVYMNLGASGSSSSDRSSVDVGVEQFIADLTGAYRFSKSFEVLAGLRYTDLSSRTTLYAPVNTREAKVHQGWVDPVVGVQAFVPLSRAFQLQARGDVGGFGVGCEFTWQATLRVNWDASRTVRVGVGYRWLQQDYRTGSGNEEFRWDVLTQGPLVAVGVTF